MLDMKVKTIGEKTVIELTAERCSTYTNTGRGFWVISLKQRKFLRPARRVKDTAVWYLLPGTYLFAWWFYWNKSKPPHVVTFVLTKLGVEGDKVVFEKLKKVEYETYDDGSPLPDDHPAKQLVIAVLKRTPGYHGGPRWEEGPAPLPEPLEQLFIGYVPVQE